jgi:trimeric autotransporter adhesin
VTAASLSNEKITINDATNVTLSYNDLDDNNALKIGSNSNVDTALLIADIGSDVNDPQISYKTNLYNAQGLGYFNPAGMAATSYTLNNDNSSVAAITTDRAKISNLNLISDQGSPVGGLSAVRGWDISKKSSTAELNFQYQNTDISGQPAVPQHTVMQLDGLNYQLQLPTTGTQIVFSGDTNLYRSSANVLKTDDNLVVGGLTANTALATNSSKQLVSSVTTSTELDYLSGTNSPVQTQLNNKLSITSGIMTGVLQLSSGSTGNPALTFTGSTTTGLSANNDILALSTAGNAGLTIAANGTVAINQLTVPGVVHNDSSGNLISSTIVNADISAGAAISDSKLATISTVNKVLNSATSAASANTANAIVARDNSGNFNAGIITANLIGNVTGNLTGNASTATTATSATTATTATNFSASLVGDVTGTQGATVVSTVSGVSASNVASGANLANAATNNNTASTIVKRDSLGNFTVNMVTLDGVTTLATDAATKAYVDSVAGLGLEPKTPALVVSVDNSAITGLYTIDGVSLVDGNRVLLVAQTTAIENGLWVAHAGAWTRPSDFNTGDLAGEAYVLIISGTLYAGSSWLCNTPTAVIGTDSIEFAQFSLPSQTTAANVGTGAGQLFRDKTGQTLNLKTVAAGTHVSVTNNTNDISLATDATSANTANTIVARDSSGNFSASTISASLNGLASLNLPLTGGTLTGNLNLASQQELRLQDAAGGQYIGLNAPTTVGASYTVNLPASAPTLGQVLQATSASTTGWATMGGAPIASKTYYVSKAGSDDNDGSQAAPFLTVSKAVEQANLVATSINPVAIEIGAGIFVEDNSAGPIAITSSGISLVGVSTGSTVVEPIALSQDLFSIIVTDVQFANFTLASGGTGSTASAINLTSNGSGTARFESIHIQQFNIGLSLNSAAGIPIVLLNNVQLRGNNTSIAISSIRALIKNTVFLGPNTGSTIANTGISITGETALVTILSNSFRLMQTGISVTGNAFLRILSTNFENSTNSVVVNGASSTRLVGCNFVINNSSTVNFMASDTGTTATLTGCNFSCKDVAGIVQGAAVKSLAGAEVELNACSIEDAVVGLQCGMAGDTSTTSLRAASVSFINNTTDIMQVGASTLKFISGNFDSAKISIADTTNVSIAAFNEQNDNILSIGNNVDTTHEIYQILNGQTDLPGVTYEPNYYGNKGLIYKNLNNNSTLTGTQAQSNNVSNYMITGDSSKTAGISLISDTSGSIGSGTDLRGWEITKNASSAELNFQYQNSDAIGQAIVTKHSVMQLDGVNNQLQLPTAGTQIVFDSDTNLYRGSANTLQTDDNLVIGGLTTANTAIATNSNKQLVSSATTNTELGYVHGVTSAIQTQLDNKLNTTGGTMTGAIQLAAGTTNAPSLRFTGSTTTGLSASAGNLSFSANGAEAMKITSSGVVAIDNLTTPGVVHNDSSGNLTSSLVVNSDISSTAAIVDTKLATIGSAGKVLNSATTATSSNTASAIVARDSSGNFSAGTITASLTGNVTGSASSNVLKAGDTMTGTLQLPAGSAAAPALRFTGSTTTGISAITADTLSLDAGGVEAMNMNSTAITAALKFVMQGLFCNQAIQLTTATTGGSVTANSETAILILSYTGTITGYTINFPANPTNGQFFIIMINSADRITFSNVASGGATIVNGITRLDTTNTINATSGGTAVTYLYSSATNQWIRCNRG